MKHGTPACCRRCADRRRTAALPLLAAMLALCGGAGARAQEPTVYASVISTGRFIVGAADAGTGLFLQTPSADTVWRHTGPMRTRANGFAVDAATRGRRVYIAAGNGLLRSTDGGAHWRVTTDWRVTEVLGVAADPRDFGRLFIATAYGIWASRDSGDTWTPANTGRIRPYFTSSIIADHRSSGALYCTAEDGVYRSTDAGRRWRKLPSIDLRARTIVQHPRDGRILAVGTEDHGVLVSRDEGRTWTAAADSMSHACVYVVIFDPDDPRTLYAGGYGIGVQKSTDGGATWRPLNDGLRNRIVHALALDPRAPERMYAGTIWGGLYRSENGGVSWTYAGLLDSQVWSVAVVRFDEEPRAPGDPATRMTRTAGRPARARAALAAERRPAPAVRARATSPMTHRDSAFAVRARYVASVYDTTARPGIYGAAVRYARNVEITLADSLFLASDQLRKPQGDMFWMFPVIGTYLYGRDRMSETVRAAVRHAWKTYFPYRGDTENHWCMYYTSLYLAAQEWPGLPGSEWFNGRSSGENLRESRDYLLHWIRITTTIGQGEFDSPIYLPEYLISMSLLARFARDPFMQRAGTMMLDLLLADFAVDHLDGMYLGGNSREGPSTVYLPRTAASADFAFLYFGTKDSIRSGWALLPALSDYRLPEVIERMANDRSEPYVNRERKRVRNVIRFSQTLNPPVYRTSYVTSEYGLTSLQGGILQPIQQHTWSVRFRGGAPASTIFGLHPWWSGRELAMFFPEEERILTFDVARSKGTYNTETKWTGSSPYERIFQYKSTLLALYDIDDDAESGHIDAFFPSTLDERIPDPSGWILCRAGATYVGWYPLQDGEWMRLPEDGGHWRFRSAHRQNGCVVEVRDARTAGTFASFCARLRNRIPRAVLERGRVSVRYVTIDGDVLSFAFPDARVVNGARVDLTKTPLFDSPFMQSAAGSGRITLRYGRLKRTLDFTRMRVTE